AGAAGRICVCALAGAAARAKTGGSALPSAGRQPGAASDSSFPRVEAAGRLRSPAPHLWVARGYGGPSLFSFVIHQPAASELVFAFERRCNSLAFFRAFERRLHGGPAGVSGSDRADANESGAGMGMVAGLWSLCAFMWGSCVSSEANRSARSGRERARRAGSGGFRTHFVGGARGLCFGAAARFHQSPDAKCRRDSVSLG